MILRVCDNCKKMFKSIGENKVCPLCMIDHEGEFRRVKEYLRENPGTSMAALAEEVNVSISLLEQYLRQERIEVSPSSPIMLACNKCGAEIVTGMYCDECRKNMVGEFQKIKNTIIANEREEKREKGQLKYVSAKWRS